MHGLNWQLPGQADTATPLPALLLLAVDAVHAVLRSTAAWQVLDSCCIHSCVGASDVAHTVMDRLGEVEGSVKSGAGWRSEVGRGQIRQSLEGQEEV